MGLQGAQPELIYVLLCPTRIHHHYVRAPTNPTIQLNRGITWSTTDKNASAVLRHRNMCNKNNGGRVVDVYAHLLSHSLMSQSTSATWCMLAQVAVLFMLHVNIVFMVYCVNVMFT
jgi:hypothetical protein